MLVTLYGSVEGRRVPAADVVNVTRAGDSLKNGALIGAAVGGVGAIGVYADIEDQYGYSSNPCDTAGCKAALAAVVVGVWTGIGMLVDRAIKGREEVYRAPTDRVSWSVTPHPVARGVGVRLALKF